MDKQLLIKMLNTPSPSGFELGIQKMLIEELKEVDEAVYTHHSYTCVHAINPTSPFKVMLLAHIDEIGLIIEKVLDNGICKLTNIGSVRPQMYLGQRVWVIKFDEKGNYQTIEGVIGYCPNYNKGEISVCDLNLDLGVSSKEEALKLVDIGDVVLCQNKVVELPNNLIASRALDDKIGAFIAIEVLKKLKSLTKLGVYFASTVGEETTKRGAIFACEMIKPTITISLDVGSSTDVAYRADFTHDVKLGGGPIITIASNANLKMVNLLKKVATKYHIPYQYAVEISKTYTDFDEAYKLNGGIPSELISIPLRYMHSSVEVCSLDDVFYTIDLLCQFILNLGENETFDPFDK